MDHNKKGGWIQGSIAIPGPGPEIMPLPAPAPKPQPERPSMKRSLVMSYVEMQKWEQTYEAETGLDRGTIFPELDMPFVGEGACRND